MSAYFIVATNAGTNLEEFPVVFGLSHKQETDAIHVFQTVGFSVLVVDTSHQWWFGDDENFSGHVSEDFGVFTVLVDFFVCRDGPLRNSLLPLGFSAVDENSGVNS